MTPYLTPADLLVRAFRLPPPDREPVKLPPGAHCAVSGQPIAEGYPVAGVTTTATTEFLDAFKGSSGVLGYVSEAAARCYRAANPRMGNPCARSLLIFADGTAYMPTIARDSPATLPRLLQELGVDVPRPCWSDLVREVWPERRGQVCLVIITTDTKKRLWIRARVGALGPRTPVLLHDGPISEVRLIDWPELIVCLDLVESVYTLGWSKEAIRTGLYGAYQVCQRVGLAEARRLERALAPWRARPEFDVAVLIAQRAPNQEPASAGGESNPGEQEVSNDRGPVRADHGATQLALL